MKMFPLLAAVALLTCGLFQAGAQDLTEHEYAKSGDWVVSYYTNPSGKYVKASMMRSYPGGNYLRMTQTATHFHLDVIGDWQLLGNIGSGGKKFPVNLLLSEQSDSGGVDDQASIVSDGQDGWLRISQPFDEPSGVQDVVRNGQTLNIVFPNGKKWTFSLKGSHEAWKKVEKAESELKSKN